MEKNLLKSLRDRAKEMMLSLPFMDGRDKGELKRLYNTPFTIKDYGFLPDEDGSEYVCFTVEEDTQYFYYGGQVLTDHMKKFEEEGYHDTINKEGLPVLFGSKKSKNNREYTTVTFYPEA